MNVSQQLLAEMPHKIMQTENVKKIYEAELASTLTRREKITRLLLTGPIAKVATTLMAMQQVPQLMLSTKYRQKLIRQNSDGTTGLYKDSEGRSYVSLATAVYLEERTRKVEKLYPKKLTAKFNAASIVAIREAKDYAPRKKAGYLYDMFS